MWPGVRDDAHLEAVDLDDVAARRGPRSPAGTPGRARVRRTRPARRTPGPPRSGRGGGGSAARRRPRRRPRPTASRWRGVERARGRRRPSGAHPARAAPRCWCRRASSCSRWARARSAPARRTPRRPRRAPRHSRARLQRARASSGGLVSVAPSASSRSSTSSRHEHLDRAVAAGGEHGVAGSAYWPTSRQVSVGRRQHQHLLGVDLRRPPRSAGSQATCVGLGRDVAGELALGQGGDEEPGAVAPRLEHRRQPGPPQRAAGRCAAPARGAPGSR